MRKSRKVFGILLFVMLVIGAIGAIVLNLWNWLMPSIFGLPHIGFAQALGLLALSWILFGGMRGMHGGRRCFKRHRRPYTNFAAEGESDWPWGGRVAERV